DYDVAPAAHPDEVCRLFRRTIAIGMGSGGDIVILGNQAEQLIADATAGPQRFITGIAQATNHLNGEVAFAWRGGHAEVPSRSASPQRQQGTFSCWRCGLAEWAT